ncbi:MAG: O-antigen polymerase [Phycisphaerales bacterium]|nr:O-antigen polymerase [Phycisphaerales bacterium]
MTAALSPTKRDPLASLTLAALVIALAAVATRCTIMELNNAILDFGADGDGGGPGPSMTIALDLICWLPALLIGIRRAIDPTYVLRWHVSHLLLIGVAAWVTLSAIWAGNKFDALIGAGTWWAGASLYWAASQLCRSWLRWRPILGVSVGLLMIFVAQAVIYKYIELPETQKYWETNRAEIMSRSGRTTDDFAIQRYDQLIKNGQLQGFFRSPNTYAAVAVLAAFACAGLAWQRMRDKDEPAMVALLAIPVVFVPLVIAWTGSKTAGGTAVLAAIGLFIAWRLHEWLARKSALAYGIGVGVVLLGIVAVLTVGLTTGGLIQDSLNFRWNYWVASWHMFLAKPLLGVGWTNFGNSYLAYRLPVAAEEIKDPHNLWIRFATETGAIGLVLAVAWMAMALREATRPIAPRVASTPVNVPAWNPIQFIVVVTALFWFLRTISIFPLSLTRLEVIKTTLFAVLLLGGLVIATVRRTSGHPVADDRPAPFTLYAVLAGLLGFLLHNGLDFPMAETGPLFLFLLLLGALLGLRHPGVAGKKPQTAAAIGGLAAAGLGLVIYVGLWAVPVWIAESKIAEADATGPTGRTRDAASLYLEAMAVSPVPNPEYPRRALRWADRSEINDIFALLTKIIDADPFNAQPWLNRARYESRGQSTAAVSDFARAVSLNPNDVAMRLEYAAFLDSIGKPDEANNQIKAALDVNDQFHPDEPRRLPSAKVEELKKRLTR